MELVKFLKMNEDRQDRALDKGAKKIFLLPGATKEHLSSCIMETDCYEEGDEDELIIKMMSDKGITDAANGRAMKEYLTQHGLQYQPDLDDRIVVMKLSDFLAHFC